MTCDPDAVLAERFACLSRFLDERTRRLVAAAEAKALGYGGVSRVARLTGVSRRALHVGLGELKERPAAVAKTGRVRQAGGGRRAFGWPLKKADWNWGKEFTRRERPEMLK